MTLKTIKLCNFRCFSKSKWSFNSGINILYGPNAIGKTSVLEAISYVGLTKSFKTNDETEILKDKSDEMSVIAKFSFNNRPSNEYKVQKTKKGKTVFKNDFKYLKISDYLGDVLVVYFCNNDLINLIGTPKERRKLFEPIFCQISRSYLEECNYYKKIINERNALLKRLIFENSKQLLAVLNALDEQLVVSGIKIIDYRNNFIKKINDKSKKYHELISTKKETLEVCYNPSVEKESFAITLKQNLGTDIKRGTTTVGPHRDDIVFLVNNKNVVLYGSQGQQRSALISVKLAFVAVLKEVKNENPILLLDDIFSELDKKRQNNLLELIDPNVQTFISTATLSDVDKSILDRANIITLVKEE